VTPKKILVAGDHLLGNITPGIQQRVEKGAIERKTESPVVIYSLCAAC
jgi:hypothetical protein